MFYSTDPEDRAEFIASLEKLAAFLAGNPAVPVPMYGAEITLHADSYEDGGKEQVEHIARQLCVHVFDDTPDGHYTAYRTFGRIGYGVASIPGTAIALRNARHSYDDSIILDTSQEAETNV
jgi:hypothetical protein